MLFRSPNSVDGYFLYLFTGNETHFKVIVEDYTDPLNPVALWTGHLLPEQFNEPYSGNAFFCTFIATDGLGRIKTKKLATAFYNVKKGISVVFADCLKQTGLNFPIRIAPAIVNAVTNLNYGQIAVNTASYVDKDKNLDPYTILEKLLTSMGCKLFQWKEYWYIVGINRMTETTIECEEYDANGVYIQQTIVDRPQTNIVFYESPTVSVQPSFKTVTVNWDKNQDKSILPEDITYQLYGEPLMWYELADVNHWVKSNTNFGIGLGSYTQLINYLFTPGGFAFAPKIDPLPTEDPFNLYITPATVDAADINYISLQNPIFIEGGLGTNNIATLVIDFKLLSYSDLDVAFNAGDFANSFKYELLLDGVVLISNKPSYLLWEGFNFELSLEETKNIIGKLEVKSIPINKNGLLDLRIYAPTGVAAFSRLTFKKIEITYNTEDETLIKERNIDFTTSQTVDIFHGDDAMDITNRQYLFTDDVTFSETLVTPATTQQLPILEFYEQPYYLDGVLMWTIQLTIVSKASYDLIQAFPDDAYIKRLATGEFVKTYIIAGSSQLPDGRYYGMWAMYLEGQTAPSDFLVEGDEIWIMQPTSSIEITDDTRYLRERWRRYEHTETIRYTEALARIYHDTVKDYSFKINGVVMGFYNPLELLNFKFIDGRQFMITNCSVDIDLNETTLDLVETTKNNVTDYVDQ